jgi:hypothetical protein
LCNGLAVIVAARWPGSELNSKGKVKSAKELLEVIAAEEAREGRVGRVLVLDGPTATPPVGVHIPGWDDDPEPEPGVHVEMAVLREALLVTAPRRHGKLSEKSLERKHIDALVKLDAHPQLCALSGEHGDRQLAKEKVRDLWRRGQAEDYLGMLSQEEIERRLLAAQDLLPAGRPEGPPDEPRLAGLPGVRPGDVVGQAPGRLRHRDRDRYLLRLWLLPQRRAC